MKRAPLISRDFEEILSAPLEIQIFKIINIKEGGLTDAAKLIWVMSHVYDAGMTLYTLRNRFMTF